MCLFLLCHQSGTKEVFEGCGIKKFGRLWDPREEPVLPKLMKGSSVEKSWFTRGHPYTLAYGPPSCPYCPNLHGSHVHIPPRAPFIHRTISQFWDRLDQPKLHTCELRIICLYPILTPLVSMNPTKEKAHVGQARNAPVSMDDGSCGG